MSLIVASPVTCGTRLADRIMGPDPPTDMLPFLKPPRAAATIPFGGIGVDLPWEHRNLWPSKGRPAGANHA